MFWNIVNKNPEEVKMFYSTYHPNEFKQLYNSGVEEVISLSIFLEGRNDWIKQLTLDNVAIVELIFKPNYSSKESKRI